MLRIYIVLSLRNHCKICLQNSQILKLLIPFKCLRCPKKSSQNRKSPRHHPKHQKPHLSQVHLALTSFFQRNVCSVFENDFSPLLFINLTIKLLITFKCLRCPKKLFRKRKFPRHHPKNRKPHLPQVHLALTSFFRRSVSSVFEDDFSPLLFINLTMRLLISFKCLKFPKKLLQKRKFPRRHPKNQKFHVPQVHVDPDHILQKKCLFSF